MDMLRNGCHIPVAVLVGVVALAVSACAQPSKNKKEEALQDAVSAEIRREQDKAAAISDSLVPEGASTPSEWKGFPALKPGPELSLAELVAQVHGLAKDLRTYADADPENVARVLGFALPSDAEDRRRGVSGKVGSSTYEWAVWKRSPSAAGHSVQLVLSPAEACLSFDALSKPLLADGFRMYVPTYGDDRRITFDKLVDSGLTLYVAATVDRRDAPTCARVVMLELEPSDESLG
ncbi:hypothetical protein [Stenotrophomonas sp. 278]|uniref:hypothetical protein n=1 Tax=Stenotrophomonas sp. 278 TaxID=2479851 RepID=UPI0021AE0581|nr:hypothetical protein [Stenotrophomonas sp. 278]